jgi:hypothetical protein
MISKTRRVLSIHDAFHRKAMEDKADVLSLLQLTSLAA